MDDKGRFGETGHFKMRSGRPLDWEFVAELAKRVFSVYGEYDRILPACLDDPAFHTLIIEQDDSPVGFCMLSIGDGIGEVVAVAVDPLWQSRGLGRKLMDAMVEDASRMGIRLLVLKTATRNRVAQDLFRRIGFEKTTREEGYYTGGQSAVGMRKRL
jgi:ribosomal protein S18 acetylase RimI-like enzyme